jgi:hypothetical protein
MLHAFIIGLILFSIAIYLPGKYPRWAYYTAFTFKAVTTIVIGHFYISYEQSGDTLKYFSEAITFNQIHGSTLGNYVNALVHSDIENLSSNWHSTFFVKFIAPLAWITGGNYWTTALYLTLLNFICTWYAVVTLSQFTGRKWLTYIAFFAIPSTLAWSGGIFKESISNAATFLLAALFVRMVQAIESGHIRRKDMWIALGISLSWIVLLKIRFFLAGIWLVIIPITLWLRFFKVNHAVKWSTFLILLIVGFFSLQLWHPYLRPERLPLTFYENYVQITEASESSRTVHYPFLSPTYAGLLITVPHALITGLFRPMLFEFWDWRIIPFQMEKVAFLFLLLLSIRRIREARITSVTGVGIGAILTVACALAIVAPNFGTLIRYQSVYTPFLMLILGFLPLKQVDSHIK